MKQFTVSYLHSFHTNSDPGSFLMMPEILIIFYNFLEWYSKYRYIPYIDTVSTGIYLILIALGASLKTPGTVFQ